MKLLFKKLHKDAHIPARGKPSDAGLDIYSFESLVLEKGQKQIVGTGIASEIEEGYFVSFRDRSSLAAQYGIHVLAGVIDSNYRGEWKVVLINLGDEDYEIQKGDRIAQAIIHRVYDVECIEVSELSESERGGKGFGSSGK